ncbi:MAG: Dual-specificity kinase, spindle pole body (SPB) duplication and spindle checkpoint function [Chaenotheca gracillima]|nr:MAG: Dual-specificity kinase, spindle pole body (SPB) duplication and spindle checkpoint function [Chaenotheca gracillima]
MRPLVGRRTATICLYSKPSIQRLDWITYSDLVRSRAPSTRAFTSTSHRPSQSKFSYRVAAAYSAKGRRYDPERNVFTFNPFNRIQTAVADRNVNNLKKLGRPASGQDAFFVSRVGETEGVAFGVADGVGGWIESGIDSALFSHGLCEQMAKAASEFDTQSSPSALRAQELLATGYKNVLRDRSIPGGGSTACVAVARSDGSLNVANLGDSGFVQLRLNAVHYYSNPQTHAFNTPYQLTILPPRILAQSRIFGGLPNHDLPEDADNVDRTVRHGDVLVYATDGVWDNLSAQQVLGIVSNHMTESKAWDSSKDGIVIGDRLAKLAPEAVSSVETHPGPTLQNTLASAIAGNAKMASVNTKVDGPFAKEVQRLYPLDDYHGGKVDDICVVVAVVVEQ